MQCMQQLNGYLSLLPACTTACGPRFTKKVGPSNYADLMSHILHMCPRTWQAQYKLTEDTVPQSILKLLDTLKKIKKAFPTGCKQLGKKGKANPNDSNKRKMVSFNILIPKKSRQDAKHCMLCKTHGGMHATLNTSDCCRYVKDGTHKKGFGKGQHHNTALNKKTTQAYLQLSAKVTKLKKAKKKLKKSAWKGKHEYDSNNSNSS